MTCAIFAKFAMDIVAFDFAYRLKPKFAKIPL